MLLVLLQGAGLSLGLGLLLVAALALLFLAKCIRAHFQLQACPIPGPPSRSLVLGRWQQHKGLSMLTRLVPCHSWLELLPTCSAAAVSRHCLQATSQTFTGEET